MKQCNIVEIQHCKQLGFHGNNTEIMNMIECQQAEPWSPPGVKQYTESPWLDLCNSLIDYLISFNG